MSSSAAEMPTIASGGRGVGRTNAKQPDLTEPRTTFDAVASMTESTAAPGDAPVADAGLQSRQHDRRGADGGAAGDDDDETELDGGGGDADGGGDAGGGGEAVRKVPSFVWTDGEDDEAAYDTDIDDPEDAAEEERRRRRSDGTATDRYVASCEQLDVRPLGRVVGHLRDTTLDLSHQGLGGEGAKALARGLARNTCVEKLGLRDNCISPDASMYVGDMLRSNLYISSLNLSENDLGSLGAAAIGDMLAVNIGLTHLILSRCKLKDSDAAFIAGGIERNERLVYVDLSHNEFREEGAMLIGKAIGINSSIEYLSVAWNHVRRRGAVELCKALKRNYSVTVADLSWNGLAYDGALAVSACLKTNRYLRELNIASNRIDWKGASHIAAGLRENSTLEVLKIGQNPLTMTGCFEIVQAASAASSELELLDLDGIPINNKIAYAAERISRTREFALSHGGIIETNDVLGEKLTRAEDPLNLLMQYMDDKDLRPLDLFRTFDKVRDHVVTKEQFIQGLRKAKAPLELWQIRKVIEALDKDDAGNISYRKLNVGMKEKKLQNKLDDRKAERERRQDKERRRLLMNPEMPSTAASAASGRLLPSGTASRRSSVLDLDVSRSSRQSFASPRQALTALSAYRGGSVAGGAGGGRDSRAESVGRFRMPPIPQAPDAAASYALGAQRPASEGRSVGDATQGTGGGGSSRRASLLRSELASSTASSSRRPHSTASTVSSALS